MSKPCKAIALYRLFLITSIFSDDKTFFEPESDNVDNIVQGERDNSTRIKLGKVIPKSKNELKGFIKTLLQTFRTSKCYRSLSRSHNNGFFAKFSRLFGHLFEGGISYSLADFFQLFETAKSGKTPSLNLKNFKLQHLHPTLNFKLNLCKLAHWLICYNPDDLKHTFEIEKQNSQNLQEVVKEVIMPLIKCALDKAVYEKLIPQACEILKIAEAQANAEGSTKTAEFIELKRDFAELEAGLEMENGRLHILENLFLSTFGEKALNNFKALTLIDLQPTEIPTGEVELPRQAYQMVYKIVEIREKWMDFLQLEFNSGFTYGRGEKQENQYKLHQDDEDKVELETIPGGFKEYTIQQQLTNSTQVQCKTSFGGIIACINNLNYMNYLYALLENALNISRTQRNLLALECKIYADKINRSEKAAKGLYDAFQSSLITFRGGSTEYNQEIPPSRVYESLRKALKAGLDVSDPLVKYWESLIKLHVERGDCYEIFVYGDSHRVDHHTPNDKAEGKKRKEITKNNKLNLEDNSLVSAPINHAMPITINDKIHEKCDKNQKEISESALLRDKE